jgi:hypothetical protein
MFPAFTATGYLFTYGVFDDAGSVSDYIGVEFSSKIIKKR